MTLVDARLSFGLNHETKTGRIGLFLFANKQNILYCKCMSEHSKTHSPDRLNCGDFLVEIENPMALSDFIEESDFNIVLIDEDFLGKDVGRLQGCHLKLVNTPERPRSIQANILIKNINPLNEQAPLDELRLLHGRLSFENYKYDQVLYTSNNGPDRILVNLTNGHKAHISAVAASNSYDQILFTISVDIPLPLDKGSAYYTVVEALQLAGVVCDRVAPSKDNQLPLRQPYRFVIPEHVHEEISDVELRFFSVFAEKSAFYESLGSPGIPAFRWEHMNISELAHNYTHLTAEQIAEAVDTAVMQRREMYKQSGRLGILTHNDLVEALKQVSIANRTR